MTVELAEIIATKLLALTKWTDIHGEAENIITASWGGVLMKTALDKFRSPRWRVKHGVGSLTATAGEAAEAAEASDVIRNDEHNPPQTYVVRWEDDVEQIPWAEWLRRMVKADCNDEFLARTFFQNALLLLHRHALAVNLATKTPIKNNLPYPIEWKS